MASSNARAGRIAHVGTRLCRVGVGPAVAFTLADRGRDLAHVVAVVAVLGKRHRAAGELLVAGVRRLAQHLHLVAGVVHVVLALDGVTGGGEEARQRIAGDRAARVADVERTRRIGAHELDLYARPPTDRPSDRTHHQRARSRRDTTTSTPARSGS